MAKGGGKGSSGRGAGKGSSNTKPRSDEVELATSQVTIGGKRFHIDVKQNNIGRFVKIREGASGKGGKGGKGGPKKVNLPSAGALQFMDALRKIASPAILKAAPQPAEDGRPAPIHSEYVTLEAKRFHLDLVENARGRVLKISCVNNSGDRVTLMIPTEHNGVEELCSGLEKAMNEAGEGMLIAPLTSLGVRGPSEGGKPGEGDLDLGTKVVQVDSKKFYLNLKQNRIGRFLKLTEATGTKKESLFVPAQHVAQFRDIIASFASIDFQEQVLPPQQEGPAPPLASESIKTENKVLFLDLKANKFGRLLKISSVAKDSRSTIVLPAKPAQLEQFGKAIGDILAMTETGERAPSEETLAEASVQVQNKRFFLDLKSNLRGKFLKVTEMAEAGSRTKIIVPEAGILRFYEAIHNFAGKHARTGKGEGGKGGKGGKGDTLHSDMIVTDGKVFYLDLVDNSRGRVLKISQLQGEDRVTLMLPAVGLDKIEAGLGQVLRQGGEMVLQAEARAAGEAPGKPGEGDVNLGSELIVVEGTRFFVDLRENEVGRFMQLVQLHDGNGKRTKMNIPMPAAGQFRDTIDIFAGLDLSALKKKQAYTDADGRPATLRSEFLSLDRKVVHFDLSANAKGCVLKISMKDHHGRTSVMVPMSGLSNLRDAFTKLCR